VSLAGVCGQSHRTPGTVVRPGTMPQDVLGNGKSGMTEQQAATGLTGTAVTHLVVVIPARNEEHRLPRCLRAVQHAAHQIRTPDPLAVRVIVVADRCTDRTTQIATEHSWVDVVLSGRGRVGSARSQGVDHAVARCGGPSPAVWIASTDADSVVPADWLLTQLQCAAAGADLVLGTVRPDPTELPPQVLRTWLQRHDLTDGHPHIHGANLGVRADMYDQVGGFADVDVHEDVLLAAAVRRAGGRVISTAASPVLTSGRVTGRTPAGMAGYLNLLTGAG